MTDFDFEDIVSADADSTGLVAAVREATAELLREQPNGADVVAIGHRAWKQLTPVQQARALDLLFHAFVLQLTDEDQTSRLADASASVKSYLQGALSAARPIDDDTTVTVNAADLSNVLDELALIRYRLAMTRESGE